MVLLFPVVPTQPGPLGPLRLSLQSLCLLGSESLNLYRAPALCVAPGRPGSEEGDVNPSHGEAGGAAALSQTKAGITFQKHTNHRIHCKRSYFVVVNKNPFLIHATLLNQKLGGRC